MEEIMLKIDNVSKMYKLGQIGGTTLKEELQRLSAKIKGKDDPTKRIGSKAFNKDETFMALDNVSFEIRKGERVGIIGHNGAGKSTLLKLISRVTAPTNGMISMNGRVASMLEVGTGFHGELTGRENIYMNGAILGMTKKEIDAKIEDIIDFSECRQFINTPVKRYSSGMYVKLAFSVSAHLDSKIMIMDEVLAVGDMAFQKKCLDKMNDVSKMQGRTILYVSHNMSTIRQLCDRVIVLSKGKVIYDGDVEKAISIYMNEKKCDTERISYVYEPSEHTNRNKRNNVKLYGLDMLEVQNNKFKIGEYIKFVLHCNVDKPTDKIKIALELFYSDNTTVGTAISNDSVNFYNCGNTDIFMKFSTKNLTTGKYYAKISIFEYDEYGNKSLIDRVEPAISFEMFDTDNNDILWSHYYWGHIRLDDMIIEDIQI